MGVTVHKNSLENCNLLTKSGFSRKKVDYFDGNLLNKKMVVTKKLTKSRLLTILQVTKSGFHCISTASAHILLYNNRFVVASIPDKILYVRPYILHYAVI